MTATASAAATPDSQEGERRDSPYVGLVPYSEADAEFFFGREDDTDIIAANAKTSRLTLLYGASGVGKTSVLLAGVVPRLRELGREKVEDTPSYAIAVFRSWRRPPLTSLVEAIRLAVSDALGEEVEPPDGETPLAEVVRGWTTRVRTILIVLDQFEDYFLYHGQEEGEGTFAVEFPRVIDDAALRVNFLVSLREDAWPKLDRFEGRIPNLFGNYVRVEHLDLDSARSAIVKPIEKYNEGLSADKPRYLIEEDLVRAVLQQVKTGRLVLGDGAAAVEPLREDLANAQIETPFLQLVMERLWRVTVDSGSHELRKQTLDDQGGAEKIVKTALAETLHALNRDEQEIAAELFRYLITPSKTKIAQRTSDLAFWTKRSEADVEPVLDKLSRAHRDRIRILRPIALPAGEEGSMYEIFHDVLAEPILEWRTNYEQEREKRELAARLKAEQAEREQQARDRRVRRALFGTLGLVVFLVALTVLFFHQKSVAASQRDLAKSREGAAEALTLIDADSAAAVKKAAGAIKIRTTEAAEDALRAALSSTLLSAVLRGHSGAVETVAFSRDGQRVVTTGGDNTVRVWNAASGKVLAILRGANAPFSGALLSPDGRRVIADAFTGVFVWPANGGRPRVLRGAVAAFSPHSRYVVTAGGDGITRLWDLSRSPRVIAVMRGGTMAIDDVEFSPSGNLLGTASLDGTARLWEVPSGRQVAVLRSRSAVEGLSFDEKGVLLITAGADGVVRLWDVHKKTMIGVFKAGTSKLSAAEISPNGRFVVTANQDGKARIWSTAAGRLVAVLQHSHGQPVRAATFSPNSAYVLTASDDGTARLWRTSNGRNVAVFSEPNLAKIMDAAFSPDGRRIATASEDATARVWEVPTGSVPVTVVRPSRVLTSLLAAGFDPTGGLVIVDTDGSARVWLPSGSIDVAVQAVPNGAGASAAGFNSDGSRVAIVSSDGSIRVWEVPSGRLLAHALETSGTPSAVTFSSDGRLIAVVENDGKVAIRSADTGQLERVVSAPQSPAYAAGFSPDGKLLVTGDADGTARIWNLSRGRQKAVLRGSGFPYEVSAAAFSPDGELVATGSVDGTTRLWSTSTWQPVAVLQGQTGAVLSVTFSRVGRILVTTSTDGTARAWETSSGRTLAVFRGPRGSVLSAGFSSDGRHIAVASHDGAVRIYACDACGPVNVLLQLARRIPRP